MYNFLFSTNSFNKLPTNGSLKPIIVLDCFFSKESNNIFIKVLLTYNFVLNFNIIQQFMIISQITIFFFNKFFILFIKDFLFKKNLSNKIFLFIFVIPSVKN